MTFCADLLRVIHISLSLFVVGLHYLGDLKMPAQGLGLRTK